MTRGARVGAEPPIGRHRRDDDEEHDVDMELLDSLLAECREKVARIEDAFATELKKPVTDRSAPLLFFLDKERSTYAFGVDVLVRLRNGRRRGPQPSTHE